MRQGQQHARRARGRGRRPQNQNNRVFDSNGPDVKVRGTASTIAEKYMTLSRDAQSSGDRVAAENYLQHAEHYLRIVAANKPPVPAAQPQPDVASEQDGKAETASADADDQAPAAGGDEAGSEKPAPRTRRPRATSERNTTRRPRNTKPADTPSDEKQSADESQPAAEAGADSDDGAAAA